MSMPQTVTVNPAREVADELEEILASCDSVYPWNGGHMKPHFRLFHQKRDSEAEDGRLKLA